MRSILFSAVVGLVLSAACGGSPTAPPTPVLRVDPEGGLTVARRETGQVRAGYGVPGAQQEVTSAASWSTSNAQVATVRAGVISGLQFGTVLITVEYQGQHQTLAAIIRRRTTMDGTIRLTNAEGKQTIVVLLLYIEDRNVGYHSTSHAQASLDVRWGGEIGSISDSTVPPGPVRVSVQAIEQTSNPSPYVSDLDSRVELLDSDTKERLAVISLPIQRATLSYTD